MERLFAYGTLREDAVQERVIGRLVDGVPGTLEGFVRSEIELEGGTYPILVPEPGEAVGGTVFEVTPEELRRIDEYETTAYGRERVRLQDGSTAWAYVKPSR